MIILNTIKTIISKHKNELEKKFNVKEIGIFGSYIRGENNSNSDLDILVDFKKPISLFDYIKLENYLSDLLNIKVDLVMKKTLKKRIGKHILNEVKIV